MKSTTCKGNKTTSTYLHVTVDKNSLNTLKEALDPNQDSQSSPTKVKIADQDTVIFDHTETDNKKKGKFSVQMKSDRMRVECLRCIRVFSAENGFVLKPNNANAEITDDICSPALLSIQLTDDPERPSMKFVIPYDAKKEVCTRLSSQDMHLVYSPPGKCYIPTLGTEFPPSAFTTVIETIREITPDVSIYKRTFDINGITELDDIPELP